jgi:Endonuclease/Exonuclease/phosphatase family
MDNNILFGLQEVTTDIEGEEYLKNLGPISKFTPHHKVIYSDGHINARTQYQGIGLITSFHITPLSGDEIDVTLEETGITRVPDDPYSFEFAAELPNKWDESTMDKNCRYLQILKVTIDQKEHVIMNVHYHYHPDINKKTNDVVITLIKNIDPSIIMGDFNSNPTFDGYHDLLADRSTFYGPINGTRSLDHIFVKEELLGVWEFKEPTQLFNLKGVNLDNVDYIKQTDLDPRISNNIDHVESELRSYKEKLERGEELSWRDKPKAYLLTDENSDQILSDHNLFIFDIRTDEGTTFRLATLNILAPHNSTAYPLHPLMKDRIKDTERIKELVEVIRASNDQRELFGGNRNITIDYKSKYMKYKAKYMALKNQ